MMNAPKGLRLHIGIFGRRNVGKSSLINLVTNQALCIVSEIPGTTTDPVEKAMEIQPLGPVVLIDTAGIDDEGSLGRQRIERTKKIIDKIDIAVLVVEADMWGEFEEGLAAIFESRNIPFMIVCGKSDLAMPSSEFTALIQSKTDAFLTMSAKTGENKTLFYGKLQEITPPSWIKQNTMLGGLVSAGDIVLLVTPIDIQAPKGRMILPQVQALRDVLDSDAICIFVKENEIVNMLSMLKTPPKLVVCDSQCVLQTAQAVPKEILLTTFSILMARLKGDLETLSEGADAINT
ncbi:MAG: [FeFe] hydrogenase H-cluster maturation GTPase HydF, partial [Campylobacteraceae bacterium]|nr:[FeFe] hydrogenase H-cluster maturation GTPase HydF [Campylobacteraceae bacterium]